MRCTLEVLLAQNPIVLADGATGTNFMEMGLEPGFPPDLWNVSNPEKPTALHQQFVDAGSDIILTNTFEAAERPVVVAGSVGPTGELFEPMGEMTMESAKAAFSEQIKGLRDGGADVAWIETMSAVEEIQAAAEAAIELGMPYVYTASFDTAGMTMMGLAPSNIGRVAEGISSPPLAYGANCGVGASDMLVSNLAMTQANPDAVIVGKANCGYGGRCWCADYWRVLRDGARTYCGYACSDGQLHRR